jgi:hypothetical protein
MSEPTTYEREIEHEIEHDAAAHGGKRPKRKAGGSAKGQMAQRRMDRPARRQVGGGVGVPVARPGAGLPLAAGTGVRPVRPGVGGVAAGMPVGRGAVMPTRVSPRPVGAAAPAMVNAGSRPMGFKDGGHARRQVGGRDGGKYPERVTRPLGDEAKHDLSRSSGYYEPESKVPRDDYDEGGKTSGFHPGGEKGKLHRELGIPEGEKIGAPRIAKAEHSGDPEIRRDAIRAHTMSKWGK